MAENRAIDIITLYPIASESSSLATPYFDQCYHLHYSTYNIPFTVCGQSELPQRKSVVSLLYVLVISHHNAFCPVIAAPHHHQRIPATCHHSRLITLLKISIVKNTVREYHQIPQVKKMHHDRVRINFESSDTH